tara:strand:+ start:135 stop:881 length:747 start_codon:yes stop_codon:yes gene_type:complete
MINLCICQWYTKDISSYADITQAINRLYCEKYNIKYIYSNERLVEKRKPHFERLPFIANNLKNYDYIMWVDADAHFYLDSPNILDFLEKYKEYDFIFSKDINDLREKINGGSFECNIKNDWQINTGVFIVKNTPENINILNESAYNDNYYRRKLNYQDQGVIRLLYRDNILSLKDKSIVLPYGYLQHFNSEELHDKNNLYYNYFKMLETKDIRPFILHHAGKNGGFRISKCNAYYDKILLFNKDYFSS